jgi:predicted flap endonuclease-1-like 5' DNA nuclease
MSYLITQMLLCLLLAALLGYLIGWALRAMACNKKIAALEAEWKSRAAGAAKAQLDDLKRIEGIGPKIEKLLNGAGIHTWADLGDADIGRLKGVLERAGERYKMHDPTSWPDQAKLAAAGRWKELDDLQERLLGGRDK